jgi:glycosyltransferase involved in cell wall biosynthesis
MKASVIINTVNRAELLAECLVSLQQQVFPDFEVVVVNGPSTDGTDAEIGRYSGRLKVCRCEDMNLSVSRNIGIAASSGDVCAFIDDDAVAHPRWLERIMAPYRDPGVSAVGGFTLDHTGVAYQCRYTVCDRLGNPHYFERIDPAHFINFPGSPVYPSLLGTNSSFRRADLERIGGFDEVFAYMLDETDVCLRLNDIGGRILTVPDALVLHRYAPSHTRNVDRIPRSLLASARSKAYFCYKHRRTIGDLSIPITELSRYAEELSFSIRWFVDHEKISPAHFMRLSRELETGINEGTALAIRKQTARDWLAPHARLPSFTPFQAPRPERQLRVCLVSQGYPPAETAGIARWTAELAGGLARLGHIVHVIAATSAAATVEYHDGVWVHRVTAATENGPAVARPVPTSVYRRALAVYNEAVRIQKNWGLDVLSAPIWDVEGLVCAEHLDIPVVTSLHTTYKLALPYKEHWRDDLEYRHRHVNKIIDAEDWLFRNSALILANSNAIVRQIQDGYGVSFNPSKLIVVPHGVAAAPATVVAPAVKHVRTRVLFVGRLERRKGIDLLLDAMLAVLAKHSDVDLHLVGEEVLGDPLFDETMSSLRSRIETEGFAERVFFYGYVGDDELLMHYSSCDLFVAPSRFESFGLIALEAMRLGKPVIASDAGGLGEIFRHGIDGLLFESGSVSALRDALDLAVSSLETRRKIGEAGYETYLRKYTVDAMAANVSKGLEKLVFGKKRSGSPRGGAGLRLAAANSHS